MSKILLLFVILACFACDSGEKNAPQGTMKPAPAQKDAPIAKSSETQAKAAPASPQAADETMRQKADRILVYHNRTLDELERGFHSLADKFYENSRNYLKNYQLPARPKTGERRDLKPGAGLFDDREAAYIGMSLNGMNKALDRILDRYADLEKYAADKNIRDDGARGEKLAKQIAGAHADFLAARKTWLDIVETRAREAELILLAEHPLRRQILAGTGIFGQFREVANLLASGDPPRAMLVACRENIENLASEGAKPPFPARPALERLYRGFLKDVQTWLDAFSAGIKNGFPPAVRREMNDAGKDCAAAWNEFVREANSPGS